MASEPSFFSTFCCCSRETKEPPVTLIRSGLTPPPTEVHLPASDLNGAPPHTSISPARDTVDGLVDEKTEDSEVVNTKEYKTTKAPKWRASESTDEMNMNDVMMDELCANEDQEQRLEDAVSIRTNVIEEVNEDELRQMTEQLAKREEKEEGEKEEIKVEAPAEQTTSRSEECVSFSVMLKEGYDSPRRNETTDDEKEEEGKEEEEEENEEDAEEKLEMKTPSIEVTETAHDDKEDNEQENDKVMEKEEVATESEEEEEILLADIPQLLDSSPPQPKPRSPQPPQSIVVNGSPKGRSPEDKSDSPITPPKMSMMYADVSSDEESSDDEAEREVLPPVARPEEDKTDVEDNWEDRSEKENRVTRLSLKSNGQATMTTGAVRVTLDSVDLTDDEFSEKLI